MEHRIADRRVLRLIQKWLSAGVIENRSWTAFEEGVPQGASVSPLLANVYLHYVFDLWAHQWRNRHAHGDVVIVRFADDFVVGFEHREDAERFWADLRDRLAQFGLELNAEKTRLIEFGRLPPGIERRGASADLKRSGFSASRTSCAKTKKGRFKLKRITDSKRMQAKLRALKDELMRRRHQPDTRAGPLARQRPARARQLLRRARQQRGAARLPLLRHRALVSGAAAPQPALAPDVGADAAPPSSMATLAAVSPIPGPTPASTLAPKGGAQCASSARWDLCGGRVEPQRRRPVPTAITEASAAPAPSATLRLLSRGTGSRYKTRSRLVGSSSSSLDDAAALEQQRPRR